MGRKINPNKKKRAQKSKKKFDGRNFTFRGNVSGKDKVTKRKDYYKKQGKSVRTIKEGSSTKFYTHG